MKLLQILPEDIVKYILSFDQRITIRRGKIYFIHRLNKILYGDIERLLLKRPLPIEGRTTHHNNIVQTWCTVHLRDDSIGNYYMNRSSRGDEVIVTLCMWGTRGLYRETRFTSTG